MARKRESTLDMLILMPWWVSLLIAGLVYIGSGIAGSMQTADVGARMMAGMAAQWGPYLSLALVFIAVLSAVRSWGSERMLDRQTGIESLRALSWKGFEDLVAEAYRRQGYRVTETLGGGADGGIDLVLHREGEKTLVQCKRWKGKPVPVRVVRELYGVLTAERADAAKLVATTTFTSDAVAFAAGKPIELIDGSELLGLLKGVQTTGRIAASAETQNVETAAAVVCPLCASPMRERVAKRGANTGSRFWGCSRYPACKGSGALQ